MLRWVLCVVLVVVVPVTDCGGQLLRGVGDDREAVDSGSGGEQATVEVPTVLGQGLYRRELQPQDKQLYVSDSCKPWEETPITITQDATDLKLWADERRILVLVRKSNASELRVSEDKGTTWNVVEKTTGRNNRIYAFSVDEERLFYSKQNSNEVLLRVGDWTSANATSFHKLPNTAKVNSICSHGDFVIISGTATFGSSAIHFTRDGGKEWWNLQQSKPGAACAIDPSGSKIHIVSAGIPDFDMGNLGNLLAVPAILTSSDSGATWNSTFFYVSTSAAQSTLVTPEAQFVTTTSSIYQSCNDWFSSREESVANGGLPSGAPQELGEAVGSHKTAFVDSKTKGFGILTTSDGGDTWAQLIGPSDTTGLFTKDFYTQGLHFDSISQKLYSFWNIEGTWRLFSAVCVVATDDTK